MKETKLLGLLMPTRPAVKPIIDILRNKYSNLAEICPDDDPTEEIYFDDEIIPLIFFGGKSKTGWMKATYT